MRRVSLLFAFALAATFSLRAADNDPPGETGHAVHVEKTADATVAVDAHGKSSSDGGKTPAEEPTPVQRALGKPIDFDFVETPLADVAAFISKHSDINVILDDKAITEAGGAIDMPVTRRLKGISLKSALRITLHDHELDYLELDDNVLLITTADKARDAVVVNAYDVGDLASHGKRQSDRTAVAPLAELISSTVAPTSWTEAGGWGSIIPFESQLVISQSRDIHPQIVELLASLRQARDEPERFRSGAFGGSNSIQAKILEILHAKQNVDFKETPLKDVVEALKARHGIEIQLDTKAIADAGSGVDVPITFAAKQIRLETALKQMLSKYELSYVIDHEVLLITTNAASSQHVVTKLYMVDDLVSGSADSPDDASAYDNLIETITSTVVPTSWDDAGGTGSIRPFPLLKILVCDQTQQQHEQIAKLLAMLRAHRVQAGPPPHDQTSLSQSILRVYRLSPEHAESTGDYLDVVERLIGPKLWKTGENYLGKVPGAIIARCSPAVQTKIRDLLVELDAIPRQGGKGSGGRLNGGLGAGGGGGGGFGSGGGFSGGGAF